MELTPTRVARETARRLRRHELTTGEEIRRLRTEAGVSLGAVSAVTGIHKSHLSRIEAGRAHASIQVLTSIGVAPGADLGLRYFSGAGPRIHDRFQAAMVETFLRALDARWHVDLEVPIMRPTRGVIDIVLTDRQGPAVVACEVQSEIRRLEQTIRWNREKAEGLSARLAETPQVGDQRLVSRLLVLRSTIATRGIARQFESTLDAAYPAPTRAAVLALTTATASWPGDAVVWMHHHGSTTTLMGFAPPNVSFGRDGPRTRRSRQDESRGVA